MVILSTQTDQRVHVARRLVAAVAQGWLAQDLAVVAALTRDLVSTTGLHPASLQRLIDLWAQTHTEAELLAVQQSPPGPWQPVGDVAVVAPGNMPVATWQLLVTSWLAGNRVRLRPSRGDPFAGRNLFTAVDLVADRLQIQAHLRPRLQLQPSNRADKDSHRALLDGTAALVVMGGDTAVRAWQEFAASVGYGGLFRGHGSRHAAALVGPDADLPGVWAGLAHDLLLADGRGCLSLRTVVTWGLAADLVHDRLVAAVARARLDWPAGDLDPTWLAQRDLLVRDWQLRAALGEPRQIQSWSDAAVLTVANPMPVVPAGPGGRCAVVLAFAEPNQALQWMSDQAQLSAVSAIGLAQQALTAQSVAVGVVAPGTLQAPLPSRWEDGLPPLHHLVKAL